MGRKSIAILGTRGIPAQHGGFETFAEKLALHLVCNGWKVTVYCQETGGGSVTEELWHDIRLVKIPVASSAAIGTVAFDWKSSLRAARSDAVILTLGYNTAIFCLLYRIFHQRNLINMDGLEWQRAKWSFPAKTWLWLNERAGCLLANHLIADHPEIKKHLSTRCSSEKISMIPYGSDVLTNVGTAPLEPLDLESGGYALIVARPEPENSLLEIISAFSVRQRGLKLVALGHYHPEENTYHRRVMEAAGTEIVFAGPIYDKKIVDALRFHCRLYIHGHQVGGTNPSLVEALGAGSPVLAHDNRFNRWVAGSGAAYFANSQECSDQLDALLGDRTTLRTMSSEGCRRHAEEFTWDKVLSAYESRLEQMSLQILSD